MTELMTKSDATNSNAFVAETSDETSDCPPALASIRSSVATAVARVVIGMPSPTLACGLKTLLLLTCAASVTSSSTSMDGFLACCARDRALVAFVDPSLGNLPIREFMAAIRQAAPKLRIVLMTDVHQPHVVREAIRTGASAIIDRSADTREIHEALFAVAGGSRYLAPAIAVQLAESITLMDLTRRESEVLALLAQGECNKNIARGLGVTVGTAKTHVRAIMHKLDARSRTEAVHKAYRLGMVCLDR
jgi:two-component system, NarL family, invasion response regulator UvrY